LILFKISLKNHNSFDHKSFVNHHNNHNKIQKGNIEQIGTSLNRYWSHKKRMATGSEPEEVTNIIEIIKDDVYGVELTGAGGGGFLFAITKQEDSQDVLWKKINNQLPRPSPDLKLFACQIDSNGLVSKMNT